MQTSIRANHALALIAALLVTACGDAPDTAQESGLETYVHSLDGTPTSLDPAMAATNYSSFVVANLFDTLYRYKYLARPYELTTNLAADFPEISEDGLTYTIPIKQGVKFIDDPAFPGGEGREVTVDDIIYSLKRHFDPDTRSQGAWLWQDRIAGMDAWRAAGADFDAPVSGLTAVDDYTLRITLTQPYPQLVYTLATPFAAVVPREAVEHYGREFSVKPVGSGPFRLVSFNSSRVIMEANPGFRKEPFDLAAEGYDPEPQAFSGVARLDGQSPPFVDRIRINFIEETAARWNSFARGNETHYVMVPNERINSVLASRNPLRIADEYADKYHALTGLEAGIVYYGFNMADPAIGHNEDPGRNRRNRALRCAIRDAFDWDERNRTFYYGLGEVYPGVIPPVVPEFDPDMSRASIEHAPQRGRRRLAEHDWTPDNLPELEYGSPSGVTYRQMYEQFRAQISDIGYTTDKIDYETFANFGDFNRAIKNRQLMFFGLGWTLDYPDAQNTLQLFYGPNSTPGSNNFNYSNPEFDALYERTMTMQPGPERTRLYRRMNDIVVDDCAVISGLSRTRVYLWHKDVTMIPDREIVSGYFIRFVDRVPD